MPAATLIYPHQLFEYHPAIQKNRPIYLIEEPLILTYNPIHRAKLVLHKLSMDAYQIKLEDSGYEITRIELEHIQSTAEVFTLLKREGVCDIHVADTSDHYLERALRSSGLNRIWYETPYFILPLDEALYRFEKSKKFMANFYKALRKDRSILMEGQKPRGGKWSFDDENRKKIPKKACLPREIQVSTSKEISAAVEWSKTTDSNSYGKAVCWLPYTHEGALKYLNEFFEERFAQFGAYEDAMTTRGVRLWHSAISPLMNIGLLTPEQVVESALEYAEVNDVPINSLEGFIRQVIGWREFIRASYESDGSIMRNQNHLRHSRTLSTKFWAANTGIEPVDHAIQTALDFGFNHHIERLMVLGNVMLLSETHPDEVYRWFMGMYIDAYDWVMVPNVYGMSQFADGGSFATKPYIAGANYIRKMSDYKGGDWEAMFTGLYWRFIDKHLALFKSNHRLSMMPRLLEKMSPETRQAHFDHANAFLSNL